MSALKSFSIKQYINRRVTAIYPMFWIAYIICFSITFLTNKGMPYSIPHVNFLLNITGLDGYFLYKIPSYYQVGEWFLGCVLILYLLFPISFFLIQKRPVIFASSLLFLYVLFFYNYKFDMPFPRHFFTNFCLFVFGVYYVSYESHINFNFKNILSIIAGVVFLLLLFQGAKFKLSYNPLVLGICSFTFIIRIADLLVKSKTVCFVAKKISKYSYAIFLVHHFIADKLHLCFLNIEYNKFSHLFIFFLYVVLVLFFAKLLCFVTAYIKKIMLSIPCITDKVLLFLQMFLFFFIVLVLLLKVLPFYIQSFNHNANLVSCVPDIPVRQMDIGTFGNFCLDTPLEALNQNDIVFDGWAIDTNNRCALDSVLISVNDKIFKCEYGLLREDVSRAAQISQANLGFHVKIPKSIKKAEKITFYLISHDKTFMYEPITFFIP